jgi:hypothetical protein
LISAGNYGIEESKNLRPEQLLTTIDTTSRIQAKKTHVNLSVDPNYDMDYVEFWNFIKIKTFQSIVNPRLERYTDWKKVSDEIKSDCVLLMANHDHAFLHDDGVLFQEFVDFISKQPIGCLGAVTHWPEYMSTSKLETTTQQIGGLPILETKANEVIGTVLVRRETFQSWFLEDFTNGSKFVRPDNPFGPSVEIRERQMFIPPFEFFRHLDGYGHIGINSNYTSNLRPTIQLIPNERLIEKPWRRDFTDGRESFNPIQHVYVDQATRFPDWNPLLVLLKKSWGLGFYPRNFINLLDEKTFSTRIYLALRLSLDFKFLTTLAKSRIAWHRKVILYKIRVKISRIKSAIL